MIYFNISQDGDMPQFVKPAAEIAREVPLGGALQVLTPDDLQAKSISAQQRKWLHCKAGPVRVLIGQGWSTESAKLFLKVRYGRSFFVTEITDDNAGKAIGVFYWECRRANCSNTFLPNQVIISNEERLCPNCFGNDLRPIAVKSIMDVAVSDIGLWFENIFDAYPRIQPPNPQWKQKAKETK